MKRNCQVPNGVPFAIRQASAHVRAVAQRVAGMPSVGVDVHLQVRRAQVEHGSEVVVGPLRVNPVVRPGAHDKAGRNVAGNRRRRVSGPKNGDGPG